MSENRIEQLDNVILSPDKNSVVIIDQTLLPNRLAYTNLSRADDLYEAIVSFACGARPPSAFSRVSRVMCLRNKSIPKTMRNFHRRFIGTPGI